MKVFWYLSICAIAVAAFIPEEEQVNGENGWFVPRVNGSFFWIDREEAESLLESMSQMEGYLSSNPVNFYLFTKANRYEGQEIFATQKSIDASNFNPENPTVLTIHGWTSSKDDFLNTGVREACFSHGDHNMIAVDWDRGRSLEYISSVVGASGAGKKIGALLKLLFTYKDMDFKSVKIVGHSLGAHVAGFAGKSVEPQKVGTIIGCDPALPLYNYDKTNKRLASTDADYVEIIHTNANKLGFLKPIGSADFYPNGGKDQPGCGIDITGSCAHSRSVTYYTESVYKNNFITFNCDSYKKAVAQSCGSTYSSTRMGDLTNADKVVKGNFYVPLNEETPYGML